MKQRILTLCVAALVLSGCTNRSVTPQFETLVADTLTCGSPACRVDYAFTTITNTAKSAALAAIEQANIERFFHLEAFDGDAREALRLSLDATAAELVDAGHALSGHDFELHVAVESEAQVVDTLVNYIITRSSYLGGAHGVYSVESLNYSLGDGGRVMLRDLFTHHELHLLSGKIRAKLYEQYNAADDESLREAGFFPDNIAATENFQPTADGITFFYNPYDIGCYALGGIEVTLSHNELKELKEQ